MTTDSKIKHENDLQMQAVSSLRLGPETSGSPSLLGRLNFLSSLLGRLINALKQGCHPAQKGNTAS